MTSEILKVKKCFDYPPDLEETPLVNKKQQTFGICVKVI
jgi:hypothetical protein